VQSSIKVALQKMRRQRNAERGVVVPATAKLNKKTGTQIKALQVGDMAALFSSLATTSLSRQRSNFTIDM
jgi:hypothetical protein